MVLLFLFVIGKERENRRKVRKIMRGQGIGDIPPPRMAGGEIKNDPSSSTLLRGLDRNHGDRGGFGLAQALWALSSFKL